MSRGSCGRRRAYALTKRRRSGSRRRRTSSAWDAGMYGVGAGAYPGGGGGGGGGGGCPGYWYGAPGGGPGGGGGGGMRNAGRPSCQSPTESESLTTMVPAARSPRRLPRPLANRTIRPTPYP